MAIIYGKDRETDYASGNLAPIGKSYSRMGAAPLDMYEVWYDKEALIAYASNLGTPQADGSYDTSSVLSYVGQKVAYVDEQNKKIFHYSIELDGTLKEIGNTFLEGALIDISAANAKGEVTISHEKVAAPAIVAGTGRTYITNVETDGYGHITKLYTATESDQAVIEDTYIDVTVNEDGDYVVSHENAPTLSITNADTAAVRFITEITRDDQGHIIGYKTEKVLIPDVSLDEVSIGRTADNKIEIKGFAETTTVAGNIPRVVVKNGQKTIEWVTVKEAVSDIEDANTVTTIEAGNDGVEVDLISQSADEIKYEVSHAAAPATGDAATTANGSGRTYVTNVLIDSYGHVAKVETATETVVDTNTSHDHINGLGTVASAAGGINEEDVAINLNIGIKLADQKNDAGEITGKEIVIYDKTSNAEIAKMDAADLVEDSYLSNVAVDDDTSTLKFTFTLNNGTTKEVDVDLTHLVDTYTGEKGIYVEGYKIGHTNEVTAKTAFELETKALAHGDTFEVVEEKYDAQGHITGKQKVTYTLPAATDISGKMDLVPDATAGHYAIFGENGQVADGGAFYFEGGSRNTGDASQENSTGSIGFMLYEGHKTDSSGHIIAEVHLDVEPESGLVVTEVMNTDGQQSVVSAGKLALSDETKASLGKADSAVQNIEFIELVDPEHNGCSDADDDSEYRTTTGFELKITKGSEEEAQICQFTLSTQRDDGIVFTPNSYSTGSAGEEMVCTDISLAPWAKDRILDSVTEVATTASQGLKTTTTYTYYDEAQEKEVSTTTQPYGVMDYTKKTTIDIDESITFILNCGSAADLL